MGLLCWEQLLICTKGRSLCKLLLLLLVFVVVVFVVLVFVVFVVVVVVVFVVSVFVFVFVFVVSETDLQSSGGNKLPRFGDRIVSKTHLRCLSTFALLW